MRLVLWVVLAFLPILAHSATSSAWRFDVFLSDSPIGTHSFELIKNKKGNKVDIKADFDVTFLFFNAYSYDHSNTEVWDARCLTQLNSTTNDNGEIYNVVVNNTKKGIQVTTREDSYIAESSCVKSFAYWDNTILKEEFLLNAQTGEYTPVTVLELGKETINVRGRNMESQRHKIITDDFAIDLWYSNDGDWLSLLSTTKDGNVLRYVLR